MPCSAGPVSASQPAEIAAPCARVETLRNAQKRSEETLKSRGETAIMIVMLMLMVMTRRAVTGSSPLPNIILPPAGAT